MLQLLLISGQRNHNEERILFTMTFIFYFHLLFGLENFYDPCREYSRQTKPENTGVIGTTKTQSLLVISFSRIN